MQLRPFISLAMVMVCVFLALACHRKPGAIDNPALELSGEPEQFSATIVFAVEDDGNERELNATRIFKSGDLRREEWIEEGEPRALIWRPDLGKTYLLDIKERCYVESDTTLTSDNILKMEIESLASQNRSRVAEAADRSSASINRDAIAAAAVDRAFDHAPPPLRVETLRLADQTIDGHPCTVFERREIFSGDHIEVSATFRASDLNGLTIRTETGLGAGTQGTKLIKVWRDVRLDVPVDVFSVPADFRRVDRLPR